MRGAFVVQVQTATPTNQLEGLVEEVDSGKQARFHSETELLSFLRESFARNQQRQEEKDG
jgi:hypothetical protein